MIDTSKSRSILVTRSVLLPLHLKRIKIPEPKTLRYGLGKVWRSFSRRIRKTDLESICRKLDFSDATTVPTESDRQMLLEFGVQSDKIIVQRYGLSRHRLESLGNCGDLRENDKVVFLGTFDYRKGCLDIPFIFEHLLKNNPDLRFQLIGAKGLFDLESQIRSRFSKAIQQRLEITMEFESSALPALLKNARIAIFPSCWEGCPFSVIECLAAGIPVAAYDAPGARDILPKRWLAPIGSIETICSISDELLESKSLYDLAKESQAISLQYQWDDIGRKLIDQYESILAKKRTTL